MKELITVVAGFLIVVALALFMYVGNQKHTTAVIQNKELNQVVDKNHLELKEQLDNLEAHVAKMDSIYHK